MPKQNNTSAPIGFESELWRAADALRSNMDAAEYKHVVLGLIFLKYISDAFEAKHAALSTPTARAEGADPEDPDEYRAVNIFWVPQEARWPSLLTDAKQPTISASTATSWRPDATSARPKWRRRASRSRRRCSGWLRSCGSSRARQASWQI
jgi:type I restriction-modification system DNA methylase subunit